MQANKAKQKLTIYYDGECIMCREYAKYVKLHKTYNLDVRNAREYETQIYDFYYQGYDINKGMIALLGNEVYHGVSAVLLIEKLLTGVSYTKYIQRPNILVRAGYQLLNGCRKLLLLLQGKKKINT